MTIPRVPSEPTSTRLRSYPATSLRIAPPTETSSPGGSAASSPVTQSETTPYLNACGPPAFVAMLPPIWDCSGAPGSGANIRPLSRDQLLEPAGRNAGLDVDAPDLGLERANAVEPVEREHDAPVRHGAGGRPVPPPRGTIATSRS